MFVKIIAAISLIILYSTNISAQGTSLNSAPNLETILSEAQKQTVIYKETFRNLIAVEKKSFEEFDKNGVSDDTTSVKSDFLVYQSGKNANITAELRNVVEVDGKPVPNSQKRSNDFLAELGKEKTLESELKKIQNEGSKYDQTIEVYGLTLNEGVILAPNMRPFFDFRLVGTENYQDAEVFVIAFQQMKKSPYNVVNGKETFSSEASLFFDVDIPGALKKNDIFLRGKIWIDTKTFQIRREEQELTVQTAEPLVVLTTSFEYQTSDYGILVPKRIIVVFNELKKQKGSDKFIVRKDTTVNFEYSKFRQTNVEVQILDDVD